MGCRRRRWLLLLLLVLLVLFRGYWFFLFRHEPVVDFVEILLQENGGAGLGRENGLRQRLRLLVCVCCVIVCWPKLCDEGAIAVGDDGVFLERLVYLLLVAVRAEHGGAAAVVALPGLALGCLLLAVHVSSKDLVEGTVRLVELVLGAFFCFF